MVETKIPYLYLSKRTQRDLEQRSQFDALELASSFFRTYKTEGFGDEFEISVDATSRGQRVSLHPLKTKLENKMYQTVQRTSFDVKDNPWQLHYADNTTYLFVKNDDSDNWISLMRDKRAEINA